MATRHFYNNTTFETRGLEDNIDVSKYITLSKWTEYTLGQEPQVLIAAIQASKTPDQLIAEKWVNIGKAREALTVTTAAKNKFAANPEAIIAMSRKEVSMNSADECIWYEDWGSFTATKVELQEALNLANAEDQNLLDTILA